MFAYQNAPHVCSDQRTIRCLGQTHEGKVCNSGFSILSPDHLDEEIDDLVDPPKLTPRALRIPGTDEFVDLPPRARRSRARMTPAMRHGMEAFTQHKDGTQNPPDIYRMLYRPWLHIGKKLGARFERSRGRREDTSRFV